MPRNRVSSSLALQQRRTFLAQYREIAAGVLELLDHQTQNAPVEGRAVPGHKDVIMVSMKISFERKTFLCHVSYTYNADTVRWRAFAWEEITPDKRICPPS